MVRTTFSLASIQAPSTKSCLCVWTGVAVRPAPAVLARNMRASPAAASATSMVRKKQALLKDCRRDRSPSEWVMALPQVDQKRASMMDERLQNQWAAHLRPPIPSGMYTRKLPASKQELQMGTFAAA